MRKTEIRIWNNYSFNKTAWIQIDNSNLENIWEYINRLKINKNRINAFYVRLSENGFIYNIDYKIGNYKRFVNGLIKKFKKLEIYCDISIIDMDQEKEYKIGLEPMSPLYISKTIFPSLLPEYEKDMRIKRVPISKDDMKFIKNRKIKVPKSIRDKSIKLFIKYIIGELKWFNFWAERMKKKHNIREERKILKGSQPKTDPRPRTEIIPAITIKNYLDKNIRFWRKEYIKSKNKEAKLMAMHYIDAFQSVRISISGELLQKEEK